MTVVDLPSGSINSRRAERIMTFLNWSRQCLLCVCLLIFVKESTYCPPGVNMKAKIKTETNKQKSQLVAATSCKDTNGKPVKMHAHV